MISNVLILHIGKIGEPRVAKNGLDLPSARVVSLECTQKENKVPKSQKGIETVLVMQMGQFIYHDITHAPQFQSNGLDCCGKDRIDRNKCYHLNIPRNDPKWRGIGDCMNFTRSLRSADLKCSLDTNIQQVSEM